MDTQISHQAIEFPAPDAALACLAACPRESDLPLLAALIDQLCLGIAVTTFEGLLLHMNRAAQSAMRAGALEIGDDGRLYSLRAADTSALRSALAAAERERRSIIVAGERKSAITIAVQPLSFSRARRRRQGALLLFSPGARLNGAGIAAYADAHQLTPAESAVVAGLCDGLQAKEVAQRTRSSIATVRSHLRSIYYKTGARNLQDLLTRVASLPPMGLHGG